MSNSIPGSQPCAPTDACRVASVRAYRELRALGTADLDAFEAASHVLLLHHPDIAPPAARQVLADWLDI